MSASDTPGLIGRYQVASIIGRGAMGVIYRATDPVIGREVAIKLVRADLLGGEDRENYLARFQREAQAAGRCLHPNIVTVYDFAVHEGNPFLAMEYVEGASLDAAMRTVGRFAPRDAVAIALQVLEALSCAHGHGVVHRDIKPANVLLQTNGHIKVMDFGISSLENASLTQAGSMIGTPSYMAPEQCRGQPVDQRTDIFSVGILLFELLSGEKPFPGQTFTEVIGRLLHDEAPSLVPRLAPADAALASVVHKALRKDPAARFPTAADMAAALRAASQDVPASDHTVVMTQATLVAASGARSVPGLDADILGTLQTHLTQHVGPIAKLLLTGALKDAASLEALCDSLARKIESEPARAQFLAAVRREVALRSSGAGSLRASQAGPAPAPPHAAPLPGAAKPIPPEVIERVEAELTRHLGPIARILVKRALVKVATTKELWATLATHIESPAERRAFEAKAGV